MKTDTAHAAETLATALNVINSLKALLYAVLPFSTAQLHTDLALGDDVFEHGWTYREVPAGTRLAPARPMYTKIETEPAGAAFSVKDNDGNLLQQSALQDNVMINFTFEDRQENLERFPLNIDLGFEQQIMEASNKGIGIKKSEVTADGKSSLVYSYIEELQLPTQLGAEQMVVYSIPKKGFFDAKTGDLTQIQIIWVLSDGTELIYDSTHCQH